MLSDELVHHLVDMLAPIGAVRARRMFGGHGVYLGDDMFALVAEDVLYFKVDDGNIDAYEARDLEPFVYRRRGRPVALSFRQAPEEALDDEDLLCEWAWRVGGGAACRQGGTQEERGRRPQGRLTRQ